MFYFVTASKDASIYLQQPKQNTGFDEILEVSKVYYGNLKDTARSLIKFETTPLSQSIASGEVTMSLATMIIRQCEANEIPTDYTIYAYPVSQSWDMGIGTRFDEISTDGCTWESRKTSVSWLNGSASLESSGSFNGKGGMWFTGSFASQSYSYETADIEMDVTVPFNSWIGGTLGNEGFIIKHDSSLENDTVDYGQLKFFSKETHTIYQPKIRIGWDDSRYETGSLQALPEEYKVSLKRLKKSYKAGGRYDIEVFARELYPQKTFQNTFGYSTGSLLPTSSFYQIKDNESDDIIIPFGEYSKLSTYGNKSRISLDLTNFEVNRSYKVELKVEISGSSEYFDDDYIFEVTE